MKKIFVIIIIVAIIFVSRRNNREVDIPSAEPTIDYTNTYQNTSRANEWDVIESVCYKCDGYGYVTCSVCRGTGKNDIYEMLSPVGKAMTHSYCEGCNGTGKRVCGCCHGTGKITY